MPARFVAAGEFIRAERESTIMDASFDMEPA